MINPFEEIFRRLDNIEKMINPQVGYPTDLEKKNNHQSPLVKISVASKITGYSVNYLYHLVSIGTIPHVRRGRSLRFDTEKLSEWIEQQYVPGIKNKSDEKENK